MNLSRLSHLFSVVIQCNYVKRSTSDMIDVTS